VLATKYSRKNEMTSKKTALPGKRIVRSYSIQSSLFDELGLIAKLIKENTGVQFDRSKIISLFAEIISEIKEEIDYENITTGSEIKTEIYKAIKKKKL
jgi:hypothetical protein